MEILLLLLTAHFIGDFYLQPTEWISCRNQHHYASKGLKKHCLVHTLLNALTLFILNIAIIPAVISIIVITLSHAIVDLWKSYRPNTLGYFLLDQGIHLTIIGLISAYLNEITLLQLLQFATEQLSAANIIIVMAYLVACKPASIIISLALKRHTETLLETNKNAESNNTGLISAGAWIGYLERCLAISFMFTGQFIGIGFLVATKTIFRFGDLTKSHDMKLTEYMLLGTLLSYAIAFLIGWNAIEVYQWLN
ncbi:DUF3307 domain-containing protein [Thalassotalea sp. 1_MG-2023]|uniref:DUF3307 domain-containing protein n=1 Tax=Thalassotalea sp. 1_MG-2023 TaxID=3062680 RepID=UPI0026E4498F|nr:DUF3307 domain-containing protein [Thalassotalea sp. 1_MG-2023]MDO6427917.1 DUF3307 domain-containing protein [Thalassotalea sp. 1_MG-2023]